MRALKLIVALFAIIVPACQSVTTPPKAKIVVETPADAKSVEDVRCKLELSLN